MKTAEDLLYEKQNKIVSCPPETVLSEAIGIMEDKKIGSLYVVEDGKIIGIWTERDLLRSVKEDGFDIHSAVLKDHMVTQLHYAKHSDSAYKLMDKFLGLRVRHILVEKNEEVIGVLSVGDVLKYSLRKKFDEMKLENAEMSWEYYEEWKWPHR